MFSNRRRLISILALTAVAITSGVATGQHSLHELPSGNTGIESHAGTLLVRPAQNNNAESDAGFNGQLPVEDQGNKFRTRQAFLLSGVAVSMLAYGYFVLQFNNTRSDSEQSRLTYEADVRENAQFYVDEGVSLDQIPTYYAWEEAYTDAANARELVTLAGMSAFLLGLGAILDAATSSNRQFSGSQAHAVMPLLGVSPTSGDVLLGARIGL